MTNSPGRTDLPWNDRRGRFSALRAAACLLAAAPGLWIAFAGVTGGLGVEPYEAAIHETGVWTLRLLLVTLAITPLQRIAGWKRWAGIRRLLGIMVFVYAAAHLTLYVGDQGWNPIRAASEIAQRIYLTIGFIAVLGLGALAVTSTDAMIGRLGKRWHWLHRSVYLLAALAILHFFMQSKLEATEAALMMGFWLLLMGYRLAHRAGIPLTNPLVLAGVAVLSALATAALEAAWYGSATGIPWRAVLNANLDVTSMPRPALWVFFVGLAAGPLPFLKHWNTHRKQPIRAEKADPNQPATPPTS